MIGYNRRFSPLSDLIKDNFKYEKMSMIYTVNSGNIPDDSWIQDPEIGGGRVIGEVCHFIDMLIYINGSSAKTVYANNLRDSSQNNDVLSLTLGFENGSLGTICYFSNGNNSVPKERFEVYSNQNVAVLNDYKTLKLYMKKYKKKKTLINQDKGQQAEINAFINAIIQGKSEVIPLSDLYNTSMTTFKAIESMRIGNSCSIPCFGETENAK
jgi:predicted dehydrogenase